MMTQQRIRGNWNEIVGKLKSKWGQLTDDDLTQAEGNVEQLVGLIQRKSGESREAIEHFLDRIVEEVESPNLQDRAREYAQAAQERLRETGEEIAESVQAGYAEAERAVKKHPLETVAVAFGAGLIGGLIVGLMLRPR